MGFPSWVQESLIRNCHYLINQVPLSDTLTLSLSLSLSLSLIPYFLHNIYWSSFSTKREIVLLPWLAQCYLRAGRRKCLSP